MEKEIIFSDIRGYFDENAGI